MVADDRKPPPRVTLEPRTSGHADALFAVVADPALYRFLDEDPPASVAALCDKLRRSDARRSPDGTAHWLNWIVRDASGRLAGHVQATVPVDHAARDAPAVNVAYVIGRDFQGLGIATAAVGDMIQQVREAFGARRFVIVSERDNDASLGLARRLGFVEATGEEAGRHGLSDTEVAFVRVVD